MTVETSPHPPRAPSVLARAKVSIARGLAVSLMTLSLSNVAAAESTIFLNGRIYTANPNQPWAEALAVKDGRIDAVGSTSDIEKRRQGDSNVVDLRGHTVIPGIVDSHVHSLYGSIALHGLNLSTPEKSLWPEQTEEFVAALRTYAQAHPKDKIVFARGNFDPQTTMSPALLDRAVSDRPLVMHHVSEHSLWVNSKALALAGITNKPVANPAEEAGVRRDASGKPTGVLREISMDLVQRAVSKTLTSEEQLTMLRAGTRYLNEFGITSVVNATGNLAEIELLATLRDRKQLTVRSRNAFGAVGVPHQLTPKFLADLDTARTRYKDEWVSANLVKFFTDGASGPWPPVYQPEQFRDLVIELDRRGYQIMSHALRADSTNMILDAYSELVKRGGQRDRRLRIEHADRLENGDVERFAKLDIIASMQPTFCCNPDRPDAPVQDPWNTLLKAGVKLAFSSDWPCTWPSDPFVGMQQAVARWAWTGRSYGANQAGRVTNREVSSPEERITITDAMDAYTRGGAYAAFMDDKVGSLEPGKLADLAVLSQDVFSVAPDQIAKTRVKMTMVGGQIVYGAAP